MKKFKAILLAVVLITPLLIGTTIVAGNLGKVPIMVGNVAEEEQNEDEDSFDIFYLNDSSKSLSNKYVFLKYVFLISPTTNLFKKVFSPPPEII
jgi:hypothetical protein